MATASHRVETRSVAALAAGGAGLGLVLAASRWGATAADRCMAAAHRLGACAPGSLVLAKPYVTAAVIGFLLGALIGIAAVLAWREARATAGPRQWGASPPRRRVAVPTRPTAHRGVFTTRAPR